MVHKTLDMPKTLLLALLVFVISALSPISRASEADWEVLILTDNDILRVTADGLAERISLPAGAEEHRTGYTYYNVALSPDQSLFAFSSSVQTDTTIQSVLKIADLEAQSCCTEFFAPEGRVWEVVTIGGFDPTGRLLALNFIDSYFGDADSLLAILDVQTGDYVTTLDPQTAFGTNALFFIDWTEAGIEVMPTCFPCGASADGSTQLWQLDNNMVMPDYGYYVASTGSRLSNGEIVQAIQNLAYPISNIDSMIGPFNQIQYFTAEAFEGATPIYYNPDNLSLVDPEWVVDGQAYLIQHSTWGVEAPDFGVTLVWRTGETQAIDYDTAAVTFAGTPDGWLTYDYGTGALTQYQWREDELHVSQLGNFSSVKPLILPQLGLDEVSSIMLVGIDQ